MSEALMDTADGEWGPTAVLSLSERGLIPASGTGVEVEKRPDLADCVAGTLVGAALGHALGYPHEWAHSLRGPIRVAPSVPVGAEVHLLGWSAEALLQHDLGAPAAFADRLRTAPPLARAGNAVPAAIARLRGGAPWFEAGVGSYGSGAALRGAAAGLVLSDRPDWRPVLAGACAAVTHASPDAVEVSAAVAEVIAALLALPDGPVDPGQVLDDLLAVVPEGAGHFALQTARRRLGRDRGPRSGPEAVDALAAAAWHALTHLRTPTEALTSAVDALGDTDTVAALTGVFTGAANGLRALPSHMLAMLAARITGTDPAERTGRTKREPDRGDGSAARINFLLDRSGSMTQIADDVIGGFNSWLTAQQAEPKSCRMTLVQFDSQDPFEILAADLDITDVPPLDEATFRPRNMTPLLDAVGRLLDHAEAGARPGEDQLVVVFTDGLENASHTWTREAIFDRIARLRDAGWTFVFLGANQDSYAEAGGIGIGDGNTSNYEYDDRGARAAFESLDRGSVAWRRKRPAARRATAREFFGGVKEAEDDQRRRRRP